MSSRKAGIDAGRSNALAAIKPTAPTTAEEAALADASELQRVVGELPGTGGEIVRQGDVVRITGRDYSAGDRAVPAAEIYCVRGAKPRKDRPWLGEADKVAWLDPATGLECIMMRDSRGGFLSGYVGVPQDHPLFGWDHEAVPSELGIEVHGGLTYSCICNEGQSPEPSLAMEARRICHAVVGETPLRHASDDRAQDDAWWFGFRCDHVYDVVPARVRDRARFMGAETEAVYRDHGYVVREILNLAAQLRAIADGVPVPAREGPPLPAIGLDPKRGR